MARKPTYHVKVTIGDAIVEVEGEQKGVVSIVEALGQVLKTASKSKEAPLAAISREHSGPHVNIQTFFQQKKPTSDIEAATLVAYYYRYLAPNEQKRESIDPAFINDAFRLAGRPLPRKAEYSLYNARNAGYLDIAGGGAYRLNPVGFNLVEHTLGSGEREEQKKTKRRKPKASRRKNKRKLNS